MLPISPRSPLLTVLAFMVMLLLVNAAAARVAELQIKSRTPFAGGKAFGTAGAYEVITGKLSYAVDPRVAANQRIVDLPLATPNRDGAVSFVGDFILLKPLLAGRGNRRLLLEVTNRGNLILLPYFNFAPFNNNPGTAADAGDGFLLKQGYSLLWTAWNWDVRAGGGRLQIELPIALQDGRPKKGRVVAEMVTGHPANSLPLAWGQSRGYPASLADLATARLTVRARQDGERRPIPRSDWQLVDLDDGNQGDGRRIILAKGFEPGQLYEFSYIATKARVVGLGLASLRDAASYFRYDTSSANPLSGSIDLVLAFGHSQSARVLQHMMWQGFHMDEAGRSVFDAIFMNAPGGGKGSFNHRFAQTTRHPSQHEDHQYPADFFPFATVPQRDPVAGRTGDLLARVRAGGSFPKLFYTQTSTDYWARSASLLHTDVMGERDLPLDPHARLYVFTGAQHFIWVPSRRGRFTLCHNPSDYRFALRALLPRLDAWISSGQAPPANIRPTIAGGSLGSIAAYRRRFPDLPGANGRLRIPRHHLQPPRLDLGPRFARTGIIDIQPPKLGPPYNTLLPLPDRDGIDQGGIRLPQIAAPLGTYLGWNHRRDGAAQAIGRWSGSYIPFAGSREAAQEGDNRLALDRRYGDLSGYLDAVDRAALELAADGFLLPQDIPAILATAKGRYLAQARRDMDDPGCGYLRP